MRRLGTSDLCIYRYEIQSPAGEARKVRQRGALIPLSPENRKVLDRYGHGPAAHICDALEAPTAREVAGRILYGTVDLLSDPSHPPGCLGVNGILVGGTRTEAVCQEMAARRCAAVEALRKRFIRAKKEGDLPATEDPAALALFVSAVAQGMSVHAASTGGRSELRRVADLAMEVWPS